MKPSLLCALTALAALLVLCSCRGRELDKPVAPSQADRATITTQSQSPPAAPAPPSASSAPPPVAIAGVAPGVLYVCVVEVAGQPRQTAIELSPQVADVCRKAPEMGPCQYERETCRRNGGRVFAADGTEITRATEAEYDKRVLRIRMKSN